MSAARWSAPCWAAAPPPRAGRGRSRCPRTVATFSSSARAPLLGSVHPQLRRAGHGRGVGAVRSPGYAGWRRPPSTGTHCRRAGSRSSTHGENTTFRHDSAAGRHLVRVHRPQRHGRDVDSAAAIRSEIAWLPRHPGRHRPGRARTRWRPRDGRPPSRRPRPARPGSARCCAGWTGASTRRPPARCTSRRLGEAMARLHDQADAWTPPPDFVRIRLGPRDVLRRRDGLRRTPRPPSAGRCSRRRSATRFEAVGGPDWPT